MADDRRAETIVRDALARIQADREHGASWLAREAAQAIARAVEVGASGRSPASERVQRVETWRRHLRELAYARPSMAAIAVTVARIYAAGCQAQPARENGIALAAMRAEAERLVAACDTAADAITEHARPLLGGVVLTHSRSGTVEGVLSRLFADDNSHLDRVIVTESRPGGEGVATARALAAAGLAVTLVADAAMGLVAAEASCVALGADSLRADGSLVNKVGSSSLALAARATGIPVYVVSETLKIAPEGWPLRLEEGDPAALRLDAAPGVTVRNPLFDHTPAPLLTAIVTERGLVRPSELRPYAERAAGELALLDAPSDA